MVSYSIISWYHIMVSYHGIISWSYHIMVSYHGIIYWSYHIMVSYHGIISWYHIMVVSYHGIISTGIMTKLINAKTSFPQAEGKGQYASPRELWKEGVHTHALSLSITFSYPFPPDLVDPWPSEQQIVNKSVQNLQTYRQKYIYSLFISIYADIQTDKQTRNVRRLPLAE